MAGDNSKREPDGGDCLSAQDVIRYKQAYDNEAIDVQSGGEEMIGFDAWLKSKGLRRCPPMNG